MDGYKEWAQSFSMEWFNELLNSMEKNCSQETCSVLLDQCAECHYKSMEQMIEKYVGDLQGFLKFMTEQNGQIITYNEAENTILVDENKDYCVCPITLSMNGKKVSPVLCNCSSGMTGKMISKIVGKQVKSRVVSSVLRGDKSCVYEIIL
jgi:predicted hydrocarbon binding protein